MIPRHFLLVLAALATACGAGPPVPAPPPPAGDGARVADAVEAAKAAEAAGDRALAEGRWSEVLAARPGHTVALYALARLARARGDAGLALERLRLLTGLEPQAARGHLLAAEILADPASGPLRDLAAAEASAREGLRRNPEESGPYLVLGRVLLLANLREDAADRLSVAARMNPRDAESRSLLGVLLLRAGRDAEAAEAFRAALRAAFTPGAGATAAGVPGEGDTRESLSPGRTLGAGELRAVAGLASLGVVVAGARDGGGASPDLQAVAAAALAARGTGEAAFDRDRDGRPDGAAVARADEPPALALLEAGGVVLHGRSER